MVLCIFFFFDLKKYVGYSIANKPQLDLSGIKRYHGLFPNLWLSTEKMRPPPFLKINRNLEEGVAQHVAHPLVIGKVIGSNLGPTPRHNLRR